MIHSVSVENFLSIANEQVVNLRVPENAPDISSFVRNKNGSRYPSVVGLFGPNGSGKSSVLGAIAALSRFFKVDDESDEAAALYFFQAYRTKEWMKKPSKISVEFDGRLLGDETCTYIYILHIGHSSGYMSKYVKYEALFSRSNGKANKHFERTESSIFFSDDFDFSNDDSRLSRVKPYASLISTLAKLGHQSSNAILKAVTLNLVIEEGNYTWDKNSWQKKLEIYSENPEFITHLNSELRRMDFGLEALTVGKIGESRYFAEAKHTGLDEPIILMEESQGTQKFIHMFLGVKIVLDVGGVAIIDELDCAFHPIIIREIIGWFSDPEKNKNAGQLIFSANNAVILDYLEKEQIFFTDKSGGDGTKVYGAKNITGLRRGVSIAKKYVSGELGAIPYTG